MYEQCVMFYLYAVEYCQVTYFSESLLKFFRVERIKENMTRILIIKEINSYLKRMFYIRTIKATYRPIHIMIGFCI